jgi:hypothetical protein
MKRCDVLHELDYAGHQSVAPVATNGFHRDHEPRLQEESVLDRHKPNVGIFESIIPFLVRWQEYHVMNSLRCLLDAQAHRCQYARAS